MPASLAEKEFSQHVGTKFHVKADQREVELELIEVKGYVSQEIEQGGMERFSVFLLALAIRFCRSKSIGWGWGRANTTFTPLPTATQFIDMAPTTLLPKPSGISGGAQGGYNWQTGHFVVGGETDISWSRMSGTATVTPINRNNGFPFPGTGFLTTHQDTKWFGTVRARAGVAFGRVFLYGTGGLAYGRVNSSANSDFRPGGRFNTRRG